jgi:hypothetical protein
MNTGSLHSSFLRICWQEAWLIFLGVQLAFLRLPELLLGRI